MKNQKTPDQSPIFIIAEIGTSHNGDMKRASRLVKAAADAGADCVKTQIIFADEIIHPNTGEVKLPGGKIRLYDRFSELEQSFSFYHKLKEMTEAAGLSFLASPFGSKSLKWLLDLGCRTIKIASPELNHFPLLKQARETDSKIILSSGVSKLDDIRAALSITGIDNTVLLHCITSYPAPEDEYNLKLIPYLSDYFNVEVGVSDHSMDPILVPALSAALGAGYIEKHLTLSSSDGGLDDPFALTPAGFKKMIAAVRQTESIIKSSPQGSHEALGALEEQFGNARVKEVLGSGIKELAPSEVINYGRTNRSVHALTALPAETIITTENIALLRTEKKLKPGIRPEFLDEIMGKELKKLVESGEGISWDDLK